MNFDKQPVITPMIKSVNGVELILWDYTERAYQYESFLMYSEDFAAYSPVKFERV